MNYHSQLKFQYIKIKKRTFGFKKNTKKHDLIFTITSGKILCWVLFMLILYVYHVSIMYA